MRILRVIPTIALAILLACDKKAADDNRAEQATDTNPPTRQMSMQGVQMMPAMQDHLDSTATMTPSQLSAGMATHQDLTSRTMDAMGADMRGMGMQPDAAWSALGDSLRQDLAELSSLSGAALKDRMDAHASRLKRMMAMHEQMMKM